MSSTTALPTLPRAPLGLVEKAPDLGAVFEACGSVLTASFYRLSGTLIPLYGRIYSDAQYYSGRRITKKCGPIGGAREI